MAEQNPPLISVMMTVYNGAPYLAEAIESVLGQTCRPVELIVVDDGSDDGSGEIAERYVPALRYVRHARRGMGASRNRAVELARGAYLTYLDADDRLTPDALEKEAVALAAHPEIDVVSAMSASSSARSWTPGHGPVSGPPPNGSPDVSRPPC